MQEVEIDAFRLDDTADLPLDEAWRVLSPSECKRARAFHFERDRLRFVRGRGALRFLLAGRLKVSDPSCVKIEAGPFGKPRLPDAPALRFNLSHSDDQAVLATSASGPLGIDLEVLDRPIDPLGLGARVFNGHELDAIRSVSGTARSARFFAFWTAKESVMKLTGQGLNLEPRAISLALTGTGRPISASVAGRRTAYALSPVDLGMPGVVCTLASECAARVRVRGEGHVQTELVS